MHFWDACSLRHCLWVHRKWTNCLYIPGSRLTHLCYMFLTSPPPPYSSWTQLSCGGYLSKEILIGKCLCISVSWAFHIRGVWCVCVYVNWKCFSFHLKTFLKYMFWLETNMTASYCHYVCILSGVCLIRLFLRVSTMSLVRFSWPRATTTRHPHCSNLLLHRHQSQFLLLFLAGEYTMSLVPA